VRELIDCHIHTERCGHAVGTVDDYVRAAVKRGLVGMAITEHLPMPEGMDPHSEVSMPACDLEDYLVEVDLVRDRYPEIEIVTGVEADYLPDRMDEVRATVEEATRRSDGARLVLGSVHLLGDWTFDDPRTIESWDERGVPNGSLRRDGASRPRQEVRPRPVFRPPRTTCRGSSRGRRMRGPRRGIHRRAS
jgi:histidinol-phosphatase (PHP family)